MRDDPEPPPSTTENTRIRILMKVTIADDSRKT